MRNRIKIPFQIRIIDGLIARLQMRPYFLQGIMGRSFAAESVTTVQKVRFVEGTEDLGCCLLAFRFSLEGLSPSEPPDFHWRTASRHCHHSFR